MQEVLEKKEEWCLLQSAPVNYLTDSSFSLVEKQLLYNRGLKNLQEVSLFLEPDYHTLTDPFSLSGMREAVERISLAIKRNEKVVIYGDYDADGVTATAALTLCLRELGLSTDYYIPERESQGYGLHQEAIKELKDSGTDLVITVDCGITAIKEIDYAKEIGLEVIVTDHHALLKKGSKIILPETICINPKIDLNNHYFSELAGVGVVFKLIQAFYQRFSYKLKKGHEKWFLDLVALGTIGDVVPLVGENRTLASYGLKVFSKTKRMGLKVLMEIIGIKPEEICSYHLGFLIAPRLNAAGRLKTAHESIELLLTDDLNKARKLALQLNRFNEERQEMTQRILKEANEEILKKGKKSKIFLLAKKNWPAGVVGIVASKLTEKWNRPVILFEDKGEFYQGSARSPKGFNITAALALCSEYLLRFGGHERAAGLTLKSEHFVVLNQKLLEITDKKITESNLVKKIDIEAELQPEEINKETNVFIKKLEPFGMGNSLPLFVIYDLILTQANKVGKELKHYKLIFAGKKGIIKAIYFNYNGEVKVGLQYDVIFSVSENLWNGKATYEMKCISIREKR